MTATATTALVTSAVGEFGVAILALIAVLLGVYMAFYTLRKGLAWFRTLAK